MVRRLPVHSVSSMRDLALPTVLTGSTTTNAQVNNIPILFSSISTRFIVESYWYYWVFEFKDMFLWIRELWYAESLTLYSE